MVRCVEVRLKRPTTPLFRGSRTKAKLVGSQCFRAAYRVTVFTSRRDNARAEAFFASSL